jgi:hypothetical protein
MEREREIAKLVNVLRQTSRMAMQSEWTGSNPDTAVFCVGQYNRVLARLRELDPSVGPVFEPLPEGSSLTVAAMACRQLAAYFEDEARSGRGWGRVYGVHVGKEDFKDFWREQAQDVQDLGEFIRESIERWACGPDRRREQREQRREEPRPGETRPTGDPQQA